MDNVTHSLIGVALARSFPPLKDRHLNQAALWTSVIASNAPDFDFILSPLSGPGNLGGLLQHRGYTHTFLAVPFLAALSVGAGVAIARTRPKSWRFLFGLGFLAAFLHITADSWNEYGVHPFSPFLNRWFYGDFVFILEPLIWLCLIPFVFFSSKTRLRWVSVALGALILSVAWIFPAASRLVALGLTLWAAAQFWIQKKSNRTRWAWTSLAAILLVFGACSHLARGIFEKALSQDMPGEKLIQLASSPAPSNPFCWQMTSIAASGDQYVYRVGTTSLWPGLFPASLCNPGTARRPGTFPLKRSRLPESSHLAWVGEQQVSRIQFENLRKSDCRFAALLRFARVPYITQIRGTWIAGDLRYDEKDRAWAKILLDQDKRCPKTVPPWEPPVDRGIYAQSF